MASTGWQPHSIHMEDSTKWVCSSGGEFEVQSGGKITDDNVVRSTAASTALANYGLTVVNTSLNHTLAAPALGCIKDVVFLATTGKKARLKTGSTAIFFNSSNGKDFVIEVTAETSKVSNHGYHMRLRGGSSKQWWTASNFGSTAQWTVAFKATS